MTAAAIVAILLRQRSNDKTTPKPEAIAQTPSQNNAASPESSPSGESQPGKDDAAAGSEPSEKTTSTSHDAGESSTPRKIRRPSKPDGTPSQRANDSDEDTSPASQTRLTKAESAVIAKKLLAKLATRNVEATDTSGEADGDAFKEQPGPRRLLVGLDLYVGKDKSDKQPSITGLRTVFLGSDGRARLLKVHGSAEGQLFKLRAEPGYAVSAISVASGDRIRGVQLHYSAITADGLDSHSSYDSPWVGSAAPDDAVRLGDGRPVVGLVGTSSSAINQIGLLVALTDSAAGASESEMPAEMPPESPDSAEMPVNTSAAAEMALGPIPDSESLKAASATVRELFKEQYAGIAVTGIKPSIIMDRKFALAEKLFSTAESENDLATRYVLLDDARKLATQIGDSQAALDAIHALRQRFDVDEISLALESLTEASGVPTRSGLRHRLAENALSEISKAVAAERFGEALEFETLARKTAGRIQDSLLQQRITWRGARLAEQKKAYDDAQAALATLRRDAKDPVANTQAGCYRCFYQEDWKDGLPLLAQGSDAPLKELARQELSPPGEAVAQARLGDEWLKATPLADSLAPLYQRRARQWFQTAMPQLTAVTRLAAQAKLDKMLGGHGLRGEYYMGAGNFDTLLKTRIDPRVDFTWNRSDANVTSGPFTVRWTGWLVSPPAKSSQYQIVVEHDAGARLWLDGKPVLDEWSGSGRRELPYILQSSKPRSIKLEYFCGPNRAGAKTSLRWSQKEGFPDQPIPAEALFHTREAAEKGFGQLPVPPPADDRPLEVPSDSIAPISVSDK